MNVKQVIGIGLRGLIITLALAELGKPESCTTPNVVIPGSYDLLASVCFHVSYTDGNIYSAYRVYAANADSFLWGLPGGNIDFDYHTNRLLNWVVLDDKGRVAQDPLVCRDVALAAQTAYIISQSQELGYSGPPPTTLWTPEVLQDKADHWVHLLGICGTLDFLQAVGNAGG